VLKIELMADEYVVRDEPEELRYEILRGDDVLGGISYRLAPGVIVLVHTEVAPSEEGHGVASRLIADALADIRSRGLRVAPVCPFVTAYLRRHPEQRDLVTGDPATPE
jgi:predicted GNAT family acetyltransferase